MNGGGGRIRTHGPDQGTTVFKTAAIIHSATPPVAVLDVLSRIPSIRYIQNSVSGKSRHGVNYFYQRYLSFAIITKRHPPSAHLRPKLKAQGVEIIRLKDEDIAKFKKFAPELWVKWAKKHPLAMKAFKSQWEFMKSIKVGYYTDADLVDSNGKKLEI